jgi:hypothetical protein
VVSFTNRPLFPGGNAPGYPLDKRLDGPQSRSKRGGKEMSLPCLCRESDPGRPARSLVILLIELPRIDDDRTLLNTDRIMTTEAACNVSVCLF